MVVKEFGVNGMHSFSRIRHIGREPKIECLRKAFEDLPGTSTATIAFGTPLLRNLAAHYGPPVTHFGKRVTHHGNPITGFTSSKTGIPHRMDTVSAP